jgi:O-antigen/teichoic acid export membrane protein
MSRTRIAALTASFNYVQYALSIASGLALVPLTIGAVGPRAYGLWLATGELLGYAGMVDLGVLGVLPWMVAEADGRRDRERLRALVASGVMVGVLVGIGYALVAGFLWTMVPMAVNVPAADRSSLAGPLLVLVVVTAAAYPLRTFPALLNGLQDALFNGMLSVAQSATYFVVALIGLWRGWGLYALAFAAAASITASVAASIVRTLVVAPDLLTGWARPQSSTIRFLLSNGMGVWIAGFGWRMVAASTNMVIALVGRPEWVAIYACTAKLSAVSTQLAWVLPDSGLIGLSQLHGEGRPQARVRRVVMMIVRLHLVLAGVTACAVLAVNPAFVRAWVGPEFYGGHVLNVLLAVGLVASSLVHGLVTTASVVGNRLKIGAATIANGVVQTALAMLLGFWWTLGGIAAAAPIAALATSAPASLVLLRASTGLSVQMFWQELCSPWLQRMVPAAVVCAGVGILVRDAGLAAAGAVSAICVGASFWAVRPLLSDLPLNDRWTRRLVRARVLPSPNAVVIEPS